ncbi:hypothetical protein GGS26DRAFT_589945 [Hypomontagnella submonticulosa]|nr:hypothetical protein GGS26DRAFT_589945 [Hypomontagnella submonticulosa]
MSDTEPFIPQNVQKNKEQNNRPSYDSDETAIATARPGRLRWYKRPTLPWVLSTLSLSVVIVALLVHIITVDQFCAPSPYGRYESGFHTDLEASKPFIEGKRVQFAGSVQFSENGTMYREYNPNEPLYAGYPNPEIDKAWNDLIYGAGIDLPTDMIGRLKDDTWEEINGGEGGMWRTGLDVFHQLHCLDYVRKALYPDYYVQEDITRLFWLHVEHCIDYIRQALMCFSDATPVRLLWRKESHYLIPQFDQFHTCRNFDLLKSFSEDHALEKYAKKNKADIAKAVAEGIL